MSEPTRDDLCIYNHDLSLYRDVTDEELEPIILDLVRERVNPTCPDCEGTGIDGSTWVDATPWQPSEAEPCPRCDGRGRLGFDLAELRRIVNDEEIPYDLNTLFEAAPSLLAAARALLDLLGEEES